MDIDKYKEYNEIVSKGIIKFLVKSFILAYLSQFIPLSVIIYFTKYPVTILQLSIIVLIAVVVCCIIICPIKWVIMVNYLRRYKNTNI